MLLVLSMQCATSQNEYINAKLQNSMRKNSIYTSERKDLLLCRFKNESILLPIKVFKFKKDSLIESRKNYISFIEIENRLFGVLCIDNRGRGYVDCDYNFLKKDYQILYSIVKRFPNILFQIEKMGEKVLYFKNEDNELLYVLVETLNAELKEDISIEELRKYLNTVGLKHIKEGRSWIVPNTKKRLKYSWDSIGYGH
ncbi:MAG: hypothetical protein IKR52_03520 [Paludibacteraceae bacterium]|nr:hypothetical protein [Paludibacteraceae bacterium]